MLKNYTTKKKYLYNSSTFELWLLLNIFTVVVFSELIEQQEYKPEDLVELPAGI